MITLIHPAALVPFLKALNSLHDAQWLHGDLRSSNVMLLDESEQVQWRDRFRFCSLQSHCCVYICMCVMTE